MESKTILSMNICKNIIMQLKASKADSIPPLIVSNR
jgi:hypothetical protein